MEAYIKAISFYLPDRIVTNEDIVKDFPDWSIEKVTNKVGIIKRHVSAEDETATDMAEKVALKLFVEHKINPQDIDFILFCTQSPDYKLPTSACILQDKLGIPTSCGALDFNLGCSGYVYGLALAKGLIIGGIAKNVLLLTAETYSKYIHPTDKGNRTIFGDAASASLISTDGFACIAESVLGTDGEGAKNLIVKNGGAKYSNSKEDCDYVNSSNYLYMNGPEIFNFTIEAVPNLIKDVLTKNQLGQETIELFILHQANKLILNTIRKISNIEKDKMYLNMENIGNTVSSTIPIAISEAKLEGRLKGNILLAGFGVGYSWGGVILSVANKKINNINV